MNTILLSYVIPNAPDSRLHDSLMHVGRGRQNPLHVDYVFLGACLGFIQDSLFEAILSHPRLEMHRKIAIVKALGKVIWIQNDLIERWHNTDGSEYIQEAVSYTHLTLPTKRIV